MQKSPQLVLNKGWCFKFCKEIALMQCYSFVTIDTKTNLKQSKHRSKNDFGSLIYLHVFHGSRDTNFWRFLLLGRLGCCFFDFFGFACLVSRLAMDRLWKLYTELPITNPCHKRRKDFFRTILLPRKATFDLRLLGVSAWGVSKILKKCHFFYCLLGVSAQKFSATEGKRVVICIVVNYAEGSMLWIVFRNYHTTTGLLLTQRVQNIED